MQWYQQGDVLLKPSTIPKGAKEIASKVLVRSAVTSNEHALRGAVRVLDHNGTMYVNGVEPFEITHSDPKEGHITLTIPAGQYVVDQPQEYDHFAEEARAVAD